MIDAALTYHVWKSSAEVPELKIELDVGLFCRRFCLRGHDIGASWRRIRCCSTLLHWRRVGRCCCRPPWAAPTSPTCWITR